MEQEVSGGMSATHEISAIVIRCGCGLPEGEVANHAKMGLPCPNPRELEDLGVIASTEESC